MAASISVSKDDHWLVQNWLFDWVLRYLVMEIDDPAAKSDIQEIIDDHVAMLDLDSLPPEIRGVALERLSDGLVAAAEAGLRRDLVEREDALNGLRGLADLARGLL